MQFEKQIFGHFPVSQYSWSYEDPKLHIHTPELGGFELYRERNVCESILGEKEIEEP